MRLARVVGVVGLAGLVLVGCGGPGGPGGPVGPVGAGGAHGGGRVVAGGGVGKVVDGRRLAAEVHAAVNEYRRGMGKAGFERNAGLDRLAQQHSEYLRAHRGSFSLVGRNISHFGFENRVVVAKRALGMESVSENLLAGKRPGGYSGRDVVEAWNRSAGHHQNLWGDWECTGVGVAVDADGMIFVTQLYATRAVRNSPWSGPQVWY